MRRDKIYMKKENIIDIITDEDGRKIVVITDIRFKGKRNIDWEDVENYLKEYVGKCYEVVETADQVFIGNDFPAELKGSEDTKRLCGANAKAKANATQKIPTLLKCATKNDGRKILRGSIKLMQNMAGIVLQLGLHYLFIVVI